MVKKYETIIGLEIHLQLKTKSKMFCNCSNDGENQKPNTTVCPICLGHPGTLPTVNKEAVKQGIAMAMALNCKINSHSKFDRKNYFYPDLPKGYQISQFDEPLAHDGHLVIEVGNGHWKVGIERLHLEEDAAKNMHSTGQTLVDFNRGGTPLAEIVTKPDFRHPEEAKIFLQDLRLMARYLGVSDADMEKGHMRCDANISLRPQGEDELYEKIEVKNLNSFKAVEKALAFEEARQTELWRKSKQPKITETRGWDENKQETVLQRTKEGFADYRYFPEPDLPPLIISEKLLTEIRGSMPELPLDKKKRLIKEFGLKSEDARILVDQRQWADFFENVMSELRAWLFKAEGVKEGTDKAAKLWEEAKSKLSKLAHNWIASELFGVIGKAAVDSKDMKFEIENFAELLKLVYEKKINSSAGQIILKEMYKNGGDPSVIAEEKNLAQIDDDSTIEDLVIKVIMINTTQVEEYKAGKEAVLKYLVGQVMKESKGSANPQKVEEILKKKLK